METTVVDLIAHPDAIQPPWGFLILFWLISLVVLAVAGAAWRFRWKRWRRVYFTIFAVAWCGGVSAATWLEIGFAYEARAAAQNGDFLTVEGCLSSFHPGKPYASKTVDADEVWTLGGERFQYGAGGVGFAWHLVEPLGGAIHADTRLSVSFVRNGAYDRNEILRLKVTPHACPRAHDPGPP